MVLWLPLHYQVKLNRPKANNLHHKIALLMYILKQLSLSSVLFWNSCNNIVHKVFCHTTWTQHFILNQLCVKFKPQSKTDFVEMAILCGPRCNNAHQCTTGSAILFCFCGRSNNRKCLVTFCNFCFWKQLLITLPN